MDRQDRGDVNRESTGATSALLWSRRTRPEGEGAPAEFPELLGEFRRDQWLGDGGMGVVYRYLDVPLDRLVAVKTIPDEMLLIPGRRERLDREAKTLAALHHPNVGGIHQVLETGGRVYLILEYVPGLSLREYLDGGPMTIEQTIDFGAQLAAGIRAGHELGIVHRDIKPGNVMITPGWVVKLLDYGLASYHPRRESGRSGGGDTTSAGVVMGTVGYMSPEQARGGPTRLSADVWALGRVLFECLLGRPAIRALIRAERLESGPPCSELSGAPPSIRDLIEQCLRKEPAARPSIAEVCDALAAIRDAPERHARIEPVPHNLPAELAPFIGRKKQLRDLRELLARSRCLTVTGTGGAGKTALALRLARECVEQPVTEDDGRGTDEGVFFVGLAGVSHADHVSTAILSALRDHFVPPDGRAPEDQVCDQVRSRRLLLVLDNLEHLVPGAGPLLVRLLSRCPFLTILATSRSPLGVAGEQLYGLEGLEYASRDATSAVAEASEAAELFVARARRANHAFELTADNREPIFEICRRLAGMPLAVELAAACTAMMPAAQLEHRLLDVLDTRRILESSIERSVELLDPAERALLGRLAVFTGGWSLEAAEAVCSDAGETSIGGIPVLHVLARLVDKSLVMYVERADRARYHLLELVGEYARMRLGSHRSDDIVMRHLSFYERLVAEGAPGAEQAAWMGRLETERGNIHAAIDTSRRQDVDPDRGARMCTSLDVFWYVRGHGDEGRTHLEHAIDRRQGVDDLLRMRLLNASGTMLLQQGEHAAARDRYEQALRIATTMDDRGRMAGILTNLGNTCEDVGDLAGARASHERSMQLYEQLGDEHGAMRVRLNLGHIAVLEGAWDEARTRLAACPEAFRRSGDHQRAAVAALNCARVECGSGGADAATAADAAMVHLRQGLDDCTRIGDRRTTARTVLCMGIATAMSGRHELASSLLAAAEAMHAALGLTVHRADAEQHESARAAVTDRLGAAEPASEIGSGVASFEAAASMVDRLLGEGASDPPPAGEPTRIR